MLTSRRKGVVGLRQQAANELLTSSSDSIRSAYQTQAAANADVHIVDIIDFAYQDDSTIKSSIKAFYIGVTAEARIKIEIQHPVKQHPR